MSVFDATSSELGAIRNVELLDGMSIHSHHGWDFSADPSRSVFEKSWLLASATPNGELAVGGVNQRFSYFTDQEAALSAPPEALLSFAWPPIPRQLPQYAVVLSFQDLQEIPRGDMTTSLVVINQSGGPFYFGASVDRIARGSRKYKVPSTPSALVDPDSRAPWRRYLADITDQARLLSRGGDQRSALLKLGEVDAQALKNAGVRTEGLAYLAFAHCLYESGDYQSASDYVCRALDKLLVSTDTVAILIALGRIDAILAHGVVLPRDVEWGSPVARRFLSEGAVADVAARHLVDGPTLTSIKATLGI